jgi:hypothetical protein
MRSKSPSQNRQAVLRAAMERDSLIMEDRAFAAKRRYVRGGPDPRPDDVRLRTTGLVSLSPFDPDEAFNVGYR